MKHFLGILILIGLLAASALGQGNQLNQNRAVRPRADAAIADVVQGLYIGQFQEQVQVTNEQYVKILPLLRNGIEIMRNNANRSLRASNQLRQLLRQNSPEDQLTAQIRELDEADRQTKSAQQAFIATVDPFLSADQKARFRLFQSTFDQRLRDLVQRARQLNQTPNQQQNPQ